MLGEEIGNWKIESRIGEGGMGIVYLARHRTMGTPAALKMLSRTISLEAKFRKRFVRESQTQAQLRHPGIAQVIDFIEQKEDLFLVIEYLSGGTLAEKLEHRKELPLATSLSWTQQALTALDYAHQRGVIHRDIKPSNLMFDESGRLKVVDFGIALILDGRRSTTAGTLGTPHYMSPEQIRRPMEVDHRTDVYAMGIVLYELLAGRPPFDFEADFDIRLAQVNELPKPLREQNPEIPEELEAIVLRALAKNPDERYSGCGEFARALVAFEKNGPPLPETPNPPAQKQSGAERWRAAFIGALLLGMVVASILGAQKSDLRKSRDNLQTQVSDLQAQIGGLQTQVSDLQTQLSQAKANALGKLGEAKAWTRVLVDTFETASAWHRVPDRSLDEWGSITRDASNGKYVWDMSALRDVHRPDLGAGTLMGDGDFYLSVEVTKVASAGAGAAEASCYILLQSTVDQRYGFEVAAEKGMFEFALFDKTWKKLQDWTPSPAIHTGIGQTNRLAVLVEGSHYSLFINDTLVAEVSDNTLRNGYAGLAVGLKENGDSANFQFDNFELRRRPS